MSEGRSAGRGNKRSSDSSKPSNFVERPDRRDLDNLVEKYDNEIKEIERRQAMIQSEQKAMRSSRSGNKGEFDQARKAFNAAKSAAQAQRTLVRGLFDQAKALSTRISSQIEKDRDARKARRFRSVEDIDFRIEDLERRQETESLTLREDKDIVAQIKELNQSKREMADVTNLGKSLDAMKLQRTAVSKKIDEEKARQTELEATYTAAREEMNRLYALQPAKEDSDKLSEEYLKLRARKDEVWTLKKKAREDHKKQMDAFYEKIRAARKKREEEDKKRKVEEAREKAKAKREAAQRLATEKPWQEEIAECDQLINFLQSTIPKTTKAVVKTQKDLSIGGTQPLAAKSKGATLGGGKGKKSKSKGGKKKAFKLNLSLDSLALMGKHSIPVPSTAEEVVEAIKATQAKRAEFDTKPRPAVPVEYFFEDRINTTLGVGTVVEQRKDKLVIVTLDWHLANDTKVTAYLNHDSILNIVE